MRDNPCHCLLDQDPVDEAAWDARDRGIAEKIRKYGWNAMGVDGGEQGPWAYSIGLWHSYRSPEICVFGLPGPTGMEVVNVLGDLARDGSDLVAESRRDDVLKGYDVMLRPVHPLWYKLFFGAGLDFYTAPPLPMLQMFWPDRSGRFPWESGDDAQPLLWLTPDEHPAGRWRDFDPYGGWPFGVSLPYFEARVSAAVLTGESAIVRVIRASDGSWSFLDSTGDASGTATLADLLALDPDIAAVADLEPGRRAVRTAGGPWMRG